MNIKSLQPGNGYQLPSEAYYDQQWFDREQQDLFTGASWVGIGHSTPLAPDRTRMSLRLRALPGQDPEEFLKAFHQVTQVEDADVAARVQAAVKSPAFFVGPLTRDFEESITRFHDAYLEAIST